MSSLQGLVGSGWLQSNPKIAIKPPSMCFSPPTPPPPLTFTHTLSYPLLNPFPFNYSTLLTHFSDLNSLSTLSLNPPPSLLPSPTLYFLFQSTPFLAPINFPSPPIHSPLLSSSLSSNSLPPPVLPSPSLPLPCHSLPYTYFFTSVTFPPSFFPSLHFPSLPLPFTSLPNTYFFTSVTFPPSCPSLPFTSPQTHSPSLPPPLLFSPSLISFFIFTPYYTLFTPHLHSLYSFLCLSSLPVLFPPFIFTLFTPLTLYSLPPFTPSSLYLHSLYFFLPLSSIPPPLPGNLLFTPHLFI